MQQYAGDFSQAAIGEVIAPVYLKPYYVAEANPVGNLQFFKPLPKAFGLSNDIQDLSFYNLLHHAGKSYIRNYVKGFINSISKKLLAIWESK